MVKQRTTRTSVGHLNLHTYNQKYTNHLLLDVLADFAYKLPKSPYFQPILWRYRIDKGDTAQEATEAHPETDSGLGLPPHPFLFGVIERKRNHYCGNTFLVTVEFPDLDFCSGL